METARWTAQAVPGPASIATERTSIVSTYGPTPTGGAPAPAYACGYAPNTGTGKATASLVIGLVSLFAGWTFFAPIIGLFLGLSSRNSEPYGRSVAAWGIGLNVFCLLGWLVLVILLAIFGGTLGLFALL